MAESDHNSQNEYNNGDITVIWKPDICIHSANCARGLPQVFNPQARPWINMEGASSEQIVAQVKKCPSAALSIKGSEVVADQNENMEKAKIAAKEPAKVELEAGKNYAWCSCGLSENQPFCDGTHKGTGLSPVVFKCEESETAYLCQCKQTGNNPFCDGTHNNLA